MKVREAILWTELRTAWPVTSSKGSDAPPTGYGGSDRELSGMVKGRVPHVLKQALV